MTMREARELYIKSDCSYFKMCTNNYAAYIEYRKLDLPEETELAWRNERLQMLDLEMRRFGHYKTFIRLCEIASEFHDFEKLCLVLESLKRMKTPAFPQHRILVAEAILSMTHPKVRKGLIYWAYDNGQKAIAIVLMDQALEYLFVPDVSDADLEKRIRCGQRLCKKIIADLKLNFTDQYLRHYYNF